MGPPSVKLPPTAPPTQGMLSVTVIVTFSTLHPLMAIRGSSGFFSSPPALPMRPPTQEPLPLIVISASLTLQFFTYHSRTS